MFFENAPISLWEEDFSGIKRLLDELRSKGVTKLEKYLSENPGFVDRCMAEIRVLNVNEQTLVLLKAKSKEQLAAKLDRVFRDEMRAHFDSELRTLWSGGLTWAGEGVNYTLQGDPIDINLHWRILPG